MRNKKSNKGDGGAAAAAAAITSSPSGASNTSCYLQVRERADGVRKKPIFFFTRTKRHRKSSRHGPRFALDFVAEVTSIPLISSRRYRKRPYLSNACILMDQKDSREKRNQKTNLIEKPKNPINQVVGLGTDTGDTVPGALLFFDRRRLLFNSGEGLQRYAIEHSVKLAKLSDVLLTRLTPDASGGLPGLCLSTAEARGGGSRALCANAAANAAAAAGGGYGYGNVGSRSSNNTPIRVFGPQGLASLVGALRTFVDTSVQAVEAVEFPSSSLPYSSSPSFLPRSLPPVIEDDDVKVVPIVVTLEQTEKEVEEENGAADGAPPAPKRVRLEEAGEGRGSNESHTSSRLIPAVCYACELASIPGKFKPEAALALGVPRGPLWGRLKSGQSVEVEVEGVKKTVNPEQVSGALLPGPVALIIDCPTEEHARAMASSPAFGRWSSSSSSGKSDDGVGEAFARLAVVLHLTPDPVVVASEGYAAFCRRFDGGGGALAGEREAAGESASTTTTATRQVFANGAATRGATILSSSAALAARLNAVNSKLFPLHRLGGGEEEENGDRGAEAAATGLVVSTPSSTSVAGGNLLKFHLRPASRLGLDASAVPAPLDVSAIQADLRGAHAGILEEVARAAAEAEEATKAFTTADASNDLSPPQRTPSLPESRRGEAELVFLGTGAAAPSKYRNVTGTLLRLRKRSGGSSPSPPLLPRPAGGLLLDCGEGSLGQLTRAFGRKGALDAVSSLELIWISHIHADHHAGLPRLLMARARGVAEEEDEDEEEKKAAEAATTAATGATETKTTARSLFPPPPIIPILGPRPLRRVLAAYELVCGGPGSLRYEFFDNGDIMAAASEGETGAVAGAAAAMKTSSPPFLSSFLPPLVSRAMSRLGLGKLLPVRVFHCAHSFGLIVEQESEGEGKTAAAATTNGCEASPPMKISFSGDTRRCPALELAARGSHLLVHEATFEDGLEGEALAKNHSTTSDAVSTGKGAGVAATLLTHFSQRYPKVPPVDVIVDGNEEEEEEEEEGKKSEEEGRAEKAPHPLLRTNNNVGVAFDLLQVDVVDSATLLPALTRPLRKLFDALEGGGGEYD